MSSSYIFCFIALCVAGVYGFSKDDMSAIIKAVHPHISACSKEFEVPEGKVKDVKNSGNVDEINPCFLSCLFKGIGAMNEHGNFDPEGIIEKSKEFLKAEEDRQKLGEIVKICTPVNEEAVSDGEKGCDRAKLLLTCLMKNKGDFLKEAEIVK